MAAVKPEKSQDVTQRVMARKWPPATFFALKSSDPSLPNSLLLHTSSAGNQGAFHPVTRLRGPRRRAE
jgi:hypothetical protein